MSDWVAISSKSTAPDKRSAVFAIQNTTLQSLRMRAVPAAVEMVNAGPYEEGFFKIEPATFTLEPGEARDLTVALTMAAPADRKISVRLRIDKADVPDHYEYGPGVTLGEEREHKPPIPQWVYFAAGGLILAMILGIVLYLTRGCSEDKECGIGYKCKDRTCSCGNVETCATNTPICYQNQCKADCTAPGAMCSSGQYCDTQNKVCQTGCDDDSDCSKGYSCNVSTHECKCGNVKTCPAGDVCVENQCRDACGPAKKCAAGQHCDATAGACLPGCATDDDCSDGFSCKNKVCLCGTKRTCSASTVCFEDECRRRCGPGKPICPEENYCFNNVACLPPCSTNNDCPSGYQCDDSSHTCKCKFLNCHLIRDLDRWERLRDIRTLERPPGLLPSPAISAVPPQPLPNP